MFITYLLIRALIYPFSLLPYPTIHCLGKALGTMAYYLIGKYRKRALSNLALAYDLGLTSKEIKKFAKESVQNLMITCLEYPKLSKEKKISRIATCANPEVASRSIEKGKGAIFFCGHQANWELLFLEGTSRMSGVAIGRPIANRYLYSWVKRIREKFGGKIVTPKNGVKEGLRALKRGSFMGIVGDQGMPDSGFSSRFLGRLAYTSPLPALLAYRTGAPIFVATVERKEGHYLIEYSNPLVADLSQPMEKEIRRLMKNALKIYAHSIAKKPSQWLWIHNRWKQQTVGKLKRSYRQDCLALFVGKNQEILDQLHQIRELYPTEELIIFLPKGWGELLSFSAEVHPYTQLREVLQQDYRFKLIVNFTDKRKIERHYLRLAAQVAIHCPSVGDFIEKATHA